MDRFEIPPIMYWSIYRANLQPPESPIEVFSRDDIKVFLDPGPLNFSYSMPNKVLSPPRAGILGSTNVNVELPKSSYVVIRLEIPSQIRSHPGQYAALRASEAAALFELRHAPLLDDRVYQGPVVRSGEVIILSDSPFTLTARPSLQPEVVAADVEPDFETIEKLEPNTRERFRLASRWFIRGVELANPVDKLLSWWTALEIYPALGNRHVSDRTSELLQQTLYPKLEKSVIKDRLSLGQIEGERGNVIHRGIAYPPEDQEKKYEDYLRKLQAVATTCLRILAVLPVDQSLIDHYVVDGT